MIRINNQLPSFVKDEYPRFYEFINSFYSSQESFGFPFDIINNFMEYFNIENIEKYTEYCTLSNSISANDIFIDVDSTFGFNDQNGLLLIDDEIIMYFNKTDTNFEYCNRGYSGTRQYEDYKFEQTIASSHVAGTRVINLGYSLLKFLFDRQKNNFIPDYNYTEELNLVNFIKHIKSLYSRKGTSESFNILIRALFNTNNETIYPRDNLFIPSGSTYVKKNLIRVGAISGSPLELIGQRIFQEPDDIELPSFGTYTEGNYVYINNVTERFTETGSIFELEFDNYHERLKINPTTRLLRELIPNNTIINVDSTIGFPESGYILIGSEVISYASKNLNQFLGCIRNRYGTASTYDVSETVTVPWRYFGYSNIDNTIIEIDVLGVLSNVDITHSKTNYFPDDIIKFETLGFSTPDTIIDSFYYNNTQFIDIASYEVSGSSLDITTSELHTLSVGDTVRFYNFNQSIFNSVSVVVSVTSDTVFSVLMPALTTPTGNPFCILRFRMKGDVPCDVCNTYDQNQEYVYISSHGVPSHPSDIPSLTGTPFSSQNSLKRISRIPNTETGNFDIDSVPVGIFANGVEAKSFVGSTVIDFGDIVSLVLENEGTNYSVGTGSSNPLTIEGNAEGYYKVNGSISKISIINGGQGYTTAPKVDILGDGVGANIEAVVTDGAIVDFVILSAGKGYTYTPQVSIVGDGSGEIIDIEMRGGILEVVLTDAGSNYTLSPNVNIPFGNNAITVLDIQNGSITDIVIVDGGSNYFARPDIIINDPSGLGSGFKAIVNTVDGIITSVDIISQGINYSPFSTATIFTTGSGALIRAQIRQWTYNNYERLNNNQTLDSSNGGLDNTPFGNESYYYFGNPKALRQQINDNINYDLTENVIGHSKILGWAYDGNPIYGSYGYSNPNEISFIRRMESSFETVSNSNRPNYLDYPLGIFCEDYQYNEGLGDLDEHNGRFCKTPEFPDGQYCYFITSDMTGIPVFPYILGTSFKNRPDSYNYSTESFQHYIPANVVRYTKNYFEFKILGNALTRYNILQEDSASNILQENAQSLIYLETDENQFKIGSKITNVPKVLVSKVDWSSKSKIDSFDITQSGSSYAVGDNVDFTYNFDNDAAASAQVAFVNGVGVSNFNMAQYKKIKVTDIVGNFVSGYNIFNSFNGSGTTILETDAENKILYTSLNFSVDVGDIIYTSFDSSTTFAAGVSLLTRISTGNTTFALGQSLNSVDTNIVLDSSANLNSGDYLKIGNEIVDVFSGSGTSFSVYRGGYPSSYSVGTTVILLKNIRLTDNSDYQKGNYITIDSESFQIIDGQSNIFTIDRAKLNSTPALHIFGTPVYKTLPSSSKVSGTGTTTLLRLATNDVPNLSLGDNVIFNSSTNSNRYPIIISDSNSITLEYGTGITLTSFDYYTDSKTATGSLKAIKINSSGRNYKIIPGAEVVSSTGVGGEIFPVSNNIGKIQKISILEPGYGFNPDFTLAPNGKFTTNLKVNRNIVLSNINIIDGGLDYIEIPQVEIVGGNPVQNAVATASVSNGRISSIQIVDFGYGYTGKPTIKANKKLPISIDITNSIINFSKNITGIILPAQRIRLKCDDEYPTLFGNIRVTENDVYFAILGGSLDTNQIRIALSIADANNNIPINFITAGTGNLDLILDTNSAVLEAVMAETDFLVGEKIVQYDNNDQFIASGTVSSNFGWQKLSNVLRIDNKIGMFSNNFPIFGESSQSYAYVLDESTSSSYGTVDFFYQTQGELTESLGILNDHSQKVFDSFFYQFYSYVLKNEIDYKDWQKEVIQTVHPTGFKVFGQRIVNETPLIGAGSTTDSEIINVKDISFYDLSLLNYNNYFIGDANYNTTVDGEVTLLNKSIGNYLEISSSNVLIFDDISDSILNTVVSNNDIQLDSNIVSIVKKENISVIINGLKISDVFWELYFGLDENFNKISAFIKLTKIYDLGLPIQIVLNGLNFDAIKTKFALTVNGQNTGFVDKQILITLNGVIQRNSTYTISLESGIYYITFSEAPLPRTTFLGMLFQRTGFSNNKILDDIGQSYITSNSISSNLKVYDGLFSNAFRCTILNISGNTINIGNVQGTVSVGTTLFSGVISAGTSTTVTTTTSPIISTDTSFSVGNTANFNINDFINIDTEVMRITGIGTTLFNVTRNQLGTSTDFHSYNSTVTKIIPVTVNPSSIYYGFGTTTSFDLKSGGVAFTLPNDTGSILEQNYENSLVTLINNSVQASDSYNISGNRITFSENIIEGNDYYSFYYGKLLLLDDISNKFDNSSRTFSLTINNGSLFTIESSVDITPNILIFLNGILQVPNRAYIILGSKVIFTEAPQANSQFLALAYIGSDSDITAKSSKFDIEVEDYLKLERESERRKIKDITDSTTLTTDYYNYYNKKPTGSGASARANIASGKVVSVDVLSQGQDYSIPPIIYFVGGGGKGASAYPVMQNGKVISIVLINGGLNYTTRPQIIFAQSVDAYKQNRTRASFESDYNKISTLTSTLSITETNFNGYTITINNGEGFSPKGKILVYKQESGKDIYETIYYTNRSGNLLLDSKRLYENKYDRIFTLNSTSYNFGLGQSITNGSATANVIRYLDNLLFVKMVSGTFNDSDVIQDSTSTNATIVDANYLIVYHSFPIGSQVFQIE